MNVIFVLAIAIILCQYIKIKELIAENKKLNGENSRLKDIVNPSKQYKVVHGRRNIEDIKVSYELVRNDFNYLSYNIPYQNGNEMEEHIKRYIRKEFCEKLEPYIEYTIESYPDSMKYIGILHVAMIKEDE